MAAKKGLASKVTIEPTMKGTSIGRGIIKMSSMNKNKKRNFKAYRGQGK